MSKKYYQIAFFYSGYFFISIIGSHSTFKNVQECRHLDFFVSFSFSNNVFRCNLLLRCLYELESFFFVLFFFLNLLSTLLQCCSLIKKIPGVVFQATSRSLSNLWNFTRGYFSHRDGSSQNAPPEVLCIHKMLSILLSLWPI